MFYHYFLSFVYKHTYIRNMDLSRYTWHLYKVFCLANVFLGVLASSTNTTTSKPEGSQQFYVQDDDEGFPAWLIGVIILSSIALIVLVGTIIQRIMRRRAERHELYRMAS